MTKTIVGALIFFVSLWGGAYALSFSNLNEEWWSFPVFATAWLVGGLGAWVFIRGAVEMETTL